MPLLNSSYTPPRLFKNPHVQTIYPILCRQIRGVHYQRERIDTPDGDFLDLDWSFVSSKRLAILTHGLESDSQYSYIRGMVKALNQAGISALAWNLRGCSGEPNHKEHFYHGGLSEDLDAVIKHVYPRFDEIYLIGFSLGANITLKYLGEHDHEDKSKIKASINFSAPIDLEGCSSQVTSKKNRVYFQKFMRTIRHKLDAKSSRFKFAESISKLKAVSSFKEFDELFTAPLFGFESASELWAYSSSLLHLEKIKIPTLLVSAEDDPLLPASCYPTKIAKKNPHFYFEMPQYGGHVGFVSFDKPGEYWSETRAIEFISEHTQ